MKANQIIKLIIYKILGKMDGLDFVINGFYVNEDGSEVIEVLGENEKIDNVFDYTVKSSSIRKDFTGKKFKMSEQEILMNYKFHSDKTSKKTQRLGDEFKAVKTVNLVGAKPSKTVIANHNEVVVSTLPHTQNSEVEVRNLPHISHPIPSNVRSFEDEFVDKILTKHSNKPNEITLTINTEFDLNSIIKSLELLDVNVPNFMDSLFKNDVFINELKSSLISSLLGGEYSTEFTTKPIVNEVVKDDNMSLDLLESFKQMNIVYHQEMENKLSEMITKFDSKFDDVLFKLEDINNVSFNDVELIESPIIIPPFVDEIIDEKEEVKPEINRNRNPKDYGDLIEQFYARTKQ